MAWILFFQTHGLARGNEQRTPDNCPGPITVREPMRTPERMSALAVHGIRQQGFGSAGVGLCKAALEGNRVGAAVYRILAAPCCGIVLIPRTSLSADGCGHGHTGLR